MAWMSEDFERERKQRNNDSKKLARSCKKHLSERQANADKEKKEV
jgi:hypothetical protein